MAGKTLRECAASFADLQKQFALNALWFALLAAICIALAVAGSWASPTYVALAILCGILTASSVRDCDEACDLAVDAETLADEMGEPS